MEISIRIIPLDEKWYRTINHTISCETYRLNDKAARNYTKCSYKSGGARRRVKIRGTVRKRLMDYLQDNHMTAYRFAKKSGIPQSTIWSILKKEDYEVREKNIRKICKAMGISASEIMESEEEAKRNLRAGEIPVMHKYRKLDKSDQFRVQGYMDALLEKQDREKSTS